MKKTKADNSSGASRKRRPALTPEGRESQLTALAYDRAEEQLANGTASSQIIAHFLKLGSIKAQLELEKLRNENELLRAKTEKIDSEQKSDEIYREALEAFRSYSGQGGSDDY